MHGSIGDDHQMKTARLLLNVTYICDVIYSNESDLKVQIFDVKKNGFLIKHEF